MLPSLIFFMLNNSFLFLFIWFWGEIWPGHVRYTQHPSHSVCLSVCICKSVFAGSRTLLDKSSINSTPFSLKPSLSSNATSRIFFCYYHLWMDLDASLWQWRSGKQSGNHITGRRNTVAIHNHSIIKESCGQESREGQRERRSPWKRNSGLSQCDVHPSFTNPWAFILFCRTQKKKLSRMSELLSSMRRKWMRHQRRSSSKKEKKAPFCNKKSWRLHEGEWMIHVWVNCTFKIKKISPISLFCSLYALILLVEPR